MEICKVIKFQEMDYPLPVVERATNKIVYFVIQNKQFFNILADLLLEFSVYSELISNRINKKFTIIKRRAELDNILEEEKIEQFKNMFISLYTRVKDPTFRQQLAKQSKKEYLTEQECLNIIRGKLFEYLTVKCIRDRYEEKYFKCGCSVIMHGVLVSTQNRKTVDIAALKLEETFLYECKVSPDSLDRETYKYLTHLEMQLQENQVKNNIYCLALDTTDKLVTRAESFRQEFDIATTNIKMIGREYLYDNVL